MSNSGPDSKWHWLNWRISHAPLKSYVASLMREFGIGVRRIPPLIREIKRKAFHFVGLLIPLIYFIFQRVGVLRGMLDESITVAILGTIAAVVLIGDFIRLNLPSSGLNEVYLKYFSIIMRKSERAEKPLGVGFYFLGCFLSFLFFNDLIACVSIVFLVIGDFFAALIGISFGSVKIGRKSLEGSIAMFIVCFLVGIPLVFCLKYFEQLLFWGALSATLMELLCGFLPSFLDDNLTIPVACGFAMTVIASRLDVYVPGVGNVGLIWCH